MPPKEALPVARHSIWARPAAPRSFKLAAKETHGLLLVSVRSSVPHLVVVGSSAQVEPWRVLIEQSAAGVLGDNLPVSPSINVTVAWCLAGCATRAACSDVVSPKLLIVVMW